jgi:hypothetical protein
MEVLEHKKTVVDGGQDAFGTSLGDGDFATDFGDFGAFGENSEAFGDASGVGDFFKTDDHTAETEPDHSSPDSSNKSDAEEEGADSHHGSRRHERKPGSRRGNLSSGSSPTTRQKGEEKRAPPTRRRSSSRRMMSDDLGLQAQGARSSSRSRSQSVEKEIVDEDDGEGDEDDSSSKDKEHSTSGHGRRDSLRSSRSNSFRQSRRTALNPENQGRGGAGGRPGLTSHPRRQLSSRRLLANVDGTGPKKLDTQLSVRNLFSTGELEVADSDATPASEETTACIVSHSVVHRPSSRRSLMSKDPRRGVGKSLSMNQKVDRPPGPRAGPPQRAQSAMIRRPPSGRGLLNTDPKGEDGAEPGAAVPTVRPPRGPRAAPPTKSLSTGASGPVSRRHLHRAAQAEKKHEEGDEPEKPSSMRRHHRRRGGSHEDEHKAAIEEVS